MIAPGSLVLLQRLGVLLVAGVVSVSAAPALAQSEPHVGTWILNVGRSVYDPGPAPRSQTRIYTSQDSGLKAVIETIQPLGMKTRTEYFARFDGKDYPLKGNADADTIALSRVDALTFEATLKKGGKVSIVTRNTVSKDGKTMTVDAKGTSARGQPTRTNAVFARQP